MTIIVEKILSNYDSNFIMRCFLINNNLLKGSRQMNTSGIKNPTFACFYLSGINDKCSLPVYSKFRIFYYIKGFLNRESKILGFLSSKALKFLLRQKLCDLIGLKLGKFNKVKNLFLFSNTIVI
ncbi:hypothetical protein BpHYR1_039763 [Brachionus plicatilis]|uniref:Uncharacterized protein n=1 Tax=Brachionus plicatilis TaxID=10195 RepID=A0A3M7SLJ8_BRAPC|nr:hypothetical protein BpHYR1_039763 [Brachionus plicatilis]